MGLDQINDGVNPPRRETSMSKLSLSERARLEVKIALESARLDKIEETERNRPDVLTGERMTATLLLNDLLSPERKSRSRYRRTMDHGLKVLDLTVVKPRGLSKGALVNKMREEALSYVENIQRFREKNPQKLEEIAGYTLLTFVETLSFRLRVVNNLAYEALNSKSSEDRLNAIMRLEAKCNCIQLFAWMAEHADSLRYQGMLDDKKLRDVSEALKQYPPFNYRAYEALMDASYGEIEKIVYFFGIDERRIGNFSEEYQECADAKALRIGIGDKLTELNNLNVKYLQQNIPILIRACNKLFEIRKSLEAKISSSEAEASSSKLQKQ